MSYIATFLKHSKMYFDGIEVDVMEKSNNPHQGEEGTIREILDWRTECEEIILVPKSE